MKLNSIIIKGLWRKYDLQWNLDSRVNILTGSNGEGKSTIMDIIATVLLDSPQIKNLVSKFERVNIDFDDKQTIVCISFNDTLKNLKAKAESGADNSVVFQELWDDVSSNLSLDDKRNKRLNRMGIKASVSYLVKNKKIAPLSESSIKNLKVDIISTFDSSLPTEIERGKYDSLKLQGVRSSLDWDLHDLQEKYAYYLGGLATKLEQYIKDGNTVDSMYVENLYAQKNLFIKIVNEMFSETGKKININNSQLEFIIDEENKHISMYDLSSGEKQLIYILLTVLMEEQKETVLFMDEPEISLHIDWQEQLIDKILSLNPNCQLLIATHAPSLLLGGWQSCVKNIADIKQQSNVQ